MTLHINGEPRDLPDGLTVASLVAHLGMKSDRVAVELNLEIVPRANWETTALKDGDKLEIVHFVGGGSGAGPGRPSIVEGEAESARIRLTAESWTCPTCGEETARAFCPGCGEKRRSREDFSLRHFFAHALGELFHYDSKIFRTFRLLFTRPGFLTAEYIRGCRKPYLHPFQVFFIANLVYFLVQPYTHKPGLRTTLFVQTHAMQYSSLASRMADHRIAALGVTREQFAASFNHVVEVQARSLALFLVPLYALVLAALQWRKRRFLGEHLAFSLHFVAFWLVSIFLVLGPLLSWGLTFAAKHGVAVPAEAGWDRYLFYVAVVVLAAYSAPALRVAYQDSVWTSLAKAVVVALALPYILVAYRFILFLVALYFA